MNKRFLMGVATLLMVLSGQQTFTAAAAQVGVPETIVLDNIAATRAARGCTKTAPCKYLGAYVKDMRVVCLSAAASKMAGVSTRMAAAGAHLNYRIEADKYRCYVKFLPSDFEGGATLHCAQGATANYWPPHENNDWSVSFMSLGKIAIQKPNSAAVVTVAVGPNAKCYLFDEEGTALGHRLKPLADNNDHISTGYVANENVGEAYIIDDKTTDRANPMLPPAAVNKAINFLKTGQE